MSDDKFENRIKEHAEEIFGQDVEPLAGHRARFEQRLKGLKVQEPKELIVKTENGSVNKLVRVVLLKSWLTISTAVAAVVIGCLFLLPSLTEEQQSPEVTEVRNYYTLQLEEQVDATMQLIQFVDEAHRTEFLTSVQQIENDPIPEVQITDDEYIVLISNVYANKIESLRNIQNLLKEII